MHQRFIDAINQDPDDRATQLIYADWLDQQGDPRAEAWRVLIEKGKRPISARAETDRRNFWYWWYSYYNKKRNGSNRLIEVIPNQEFAYPVSREHFPTFYSAMDAAAIAWVRCHRDPEFMRETTPVEAD